jgi:hypothetical protein
VLDCPGPDWAVAPYVVLRPDDGRAEACDELATRLAEEAERRGLL